MEVDRSGETKSHVFKGRVLVRAVGSGDRTPGIELTVDQSASVKTNRAVPSRQREPRSARPNDLHAHHAEVNRHSCRNAPEFQSAAILDNSAHIAYRLTDLGTLGGMTSQASGMNDAGQVVDRLTARADQHAFLYSGGGMKDLGTLGGGFSYATGINAAGDVVGISHNAGGEMHAFLYPRSNGIKDIGAAPGFRAAATLPEWRPTPLWNLSSAVKALAGPR